MTHTLARVPAAPVDVDELKRAWHAVRAGEFRRPQRRDRPECQPSSRAAHTWAPQPWEEPVVVLGCAGSSGATTVALAMGLSATAPVRVVECGSVSTSALASASTAELGLHAGGGWLLGRRDHVQLERASEIIPGPHAVAHPIPANGLPITERDEQKVVQSCLTILDAGWEVGQLLATDSWIAETVRHVDHLVLTTRATTPGMRRLEGVLDLLAGTRGPGQVKVAVIGARRKKWPRGLEQAGGPGVRRVLDAGKYVEIPEVPAMAVAGLDSRPLPAGVVDAARRLLPTHGQHHRDSNPTRSPKKGTRSWTP